MYPDVEYLRLRPERTRNGGYIQTLIRPKSGSPRKSPTQLRGRRSRSWRRRRPRRHRIMRRRTRRFLAARVAGLAAPEAAPEVWMGACVWQLKAVLRSSSTDRPAAALPPLPTLLATHASVAPTLRFSRKGGLNRGTRHHSVEIALEVRRCEIKLGGPTQHHEHIRICNGHTFAHKIGLVAKLFSGPRETLCDVCARCLFPFCVNVAEER